MTPEQRPDIETLALAIARSPIVVARAASAKALARDPLRLRLPEGFEDADLAILRWLVEERRRAGYVLVRM
jgi:hypothetical protein